MYTLTRRTAKVDVESSFSSTSDEVPEAKGYSSRGLLLRFEIQNTVEQNETLMAAIARYIDCMQLMADVSKQLSGCFFDLSNNRVLGTMRSDAFRSCSDVFEYKHQRLVDSINVYKKEVMSPILKNFDSHTHKIAASEKKHGDDLRKVAEQVRILEKKYSKACKSKSTGYNKLLSELQVKGAELEKCKGIYQSAAMNEEDRNFSFILQKCATMIKDEYHFLHDFFQLYEAKTTAIIQSAFSVDNETPLPEDLVQKYLQANDKAPTRNISVTVDKECDSFKTTIGKEKNEIATSKLASSIEEDSDDEDDKFISEMNKLSSSPFSEFLNSNIEAETLKSPPPPPPSNFSFSTDSLLSADCVSRSSSPNSLLKSSTIISSTTNSTPILTDSVVTNSVLEPTFHPPPPPPPPPANSLLAPRLSLDNNQSLMGTFSSQSEIHSPVPGDRFNNNCSAMRRSFSAERAQKSSLTDSIRSAALKMEQRRCSVVPASQPTSMSLNDSIKQMALKRMNRVQETNEGNDSNQSIAPTDPDDDYYIVALHDFTARQPREMSIQKDDVILIKRKEVNWLYGVKGDQAGWIPTSYTRNFE